MSYSGTLYYRTATVLVGAAIIAGLYMSGSPMGARQVKLDERRIEALQRVRTVVEQFHDGNDSLPSLDEIMARAGEDSTWFRDVETGAPYQYQVLSDSTYQLCAEFARSSRDGTRYWDPAWNHPAGQHCFDFRIHDGVSKLLNP